MNKNVKVFLEMIKNYALQEHNKIDVDKDVSIEKIYNFAKRGKLLQVLYDEAYETFKDDDSCKERLAAWHKEAYFRTLTQLNRNKAFKRLNEAAIEEKISFVNFKGVALAELYSKPELRTSSDTDILADRKDEKRAVELLCRLGYEELKDKSKDQVYNYYNKEYDHLVELHFCLWEDFTGEKMDRLKMENLSDTRVTMEYEGLTLETLGRTEHLIYLIFHLVKHYSLEGAGVRFILDIVLFINRYFKEIDWERFWACMEEMKYMVFVDKVFSIGIQYMGLMTEVMNGHKIYTEDETELMVNDLAYAGRTEENRGGGYQILGIMTPYLVGEESKSEGGSFKGKLKIIFPSVKALDGKRFGYAKKYPVLLPAAWVHKWMNFIIYKIKNKGKTYSAGEKLSAAEYRIKLLKDSGLVD